MEQSNPPALVRLSEGLGPWLDRREGVGMEHDAQSSKRYHENWLDAVEAMNRQDVEMEALRSQLAHWKAFAVHAEGEYAAWKKTAGELDDELHKLRAVIAEGRTYTQADLLEAVKTERHACSICVWMVLQDALEPGADDKGLDGWMREAEARVKGRLEGGNDLQ